MTSFKKIVFIVCCVSLLGVVPAYGMEGVARLVWRHKGKITVAVGLLVMALIKRDDQQKTEAQIAEFNDKVQNHGDNPTKELLSPKSPSQESQES